MRGVVFATETHTHDGLISRAAGGGGGCKDVSPAVLVTIAKKHKCSDTVHHPCIPRATIDGFVNILQTHGCGAIGLGREFGLDPCHDCDYMPVVIPACPQECSWCASNVHHRGGEYLLGGDSSIIRLTFAYISHNNDVREYMYDYVSNSERESPRSKIGVELQSYR